MQSTQAEKITHVNTRLQSRRFRLRYWFIGLEYEFAEVWTDPEAEECDVRNRSAIRIL